MKNKLVIIKTNINDDADYSYIYDHAIQNTLTPYWQWTAENDVNVAFEKHTDNDLATYSLRLAVTATFENPSDLAMFKLTFGKFPLQSISKDSIENVHFF